MNASYQRIVLIFLPSNWELIFWCSLLNLPEIADGSLAFASHNGVLQFSVSSIKSDGNSKGRPPRKSSAPGRTEKEDEDSKSQSSDRKQPMSSKQAEIMALFRRIQSSISKGESTATKKKKASRSEENSPTNSILEVLRHSTKHAKGNLDGYASFNSRTVFVSRYDHLTCSFKEKWSFKFQVFFFTRILSYKKKTSTLNTFLCCLCLKPL